MNMAGNVADVDHDAVTPASGRVSRMNGCRRAAQGRARGVLLVLTLALSLALNSGLATAAVSDWDDPTRALFAAIEAGNLVAVQRAVLDGADVRATDDTGKNAAQLAEELGHFTITTFLLAYGALEAPPGEPAPQPPAPEPVVEAAPDPANTAASPAPVPPPEQAAESGPGEDPPRRIESSYFERLSMLNPLPRQPAVQPEGQATENAVVAAPVPMVPDPMVPDPMEPVVAAEPPPLTPEDAAAEPPPAEPGVAEISSRTTEGDPAPGFRKPGIGEETVVAMIPAPAPGEDFPGELDPVTPPLAPRSEPETLPQVPPQSTLEFLTEAPAAGESEIVAQAPAATAGASFMTRLRRFEGGAPGTLKPEDLAGAPGGESIVAEVPGAESYPAPAGDLQASDRFAGHEAIRREAIERLKAESAQRLAQLEGARDEAAQERAAEDRQRLFDRGVANVETEARAQERLALTGTPYPPGFVPPPDGGTSAVRFLQRIGVVGQAEGPYQTAATPRPSLLEPRLPNGDAPVMGPRVPSDPTLAQTPQYLRALTFIDSGYAPPPSGREIDTDDNRTVNALQQIARLLSTPDQKFPATGSLPRSGQSTQPRRRSRKPFPASRPSIPKRSRSSRCRRATCRYPRPPARPWSKANLESAVCRTARPLPRDGARRRPIRVAA